MIYYTERDIPMLEDILTMIEQQLYTEKPYEYGYSGTIVQV